MHDDYGNKEHRNTSNTKCDSGESVLPIVVVAHLSVCVNCLISGVTVKHVECSAHGTLVLPIVACVAHMGKSIA